MKTRSIFLKYIVALLLCFIALSTIAQLPDLIPYRKGDLWGYCDSNKVVKIEPRFKYAGWFNELGQAEVDVGFVDKNGNVTREQHHDFDSRYYYYYRDGKIFLVNKKTSEYKSYIHQKGSYRGNPLKYMLFKSGDTLDLYVIEKGHYKFIDSTIESMTQVCDKSVLLYTDYSTDSTSDIVVHNKLNQEIYFLIRDRDYNNRILYPNGRKKFIGKKYIQHKESDNGIFIIKTKFGSVVYNKKGKRIFKSNHTVTEFGSKLLIEYDKAGQFSNIIDLKGNYLAKGVVKIGYSDYIRNEEQCVYYMNSDSCYIFYNKFGKVKKLCRKDSVIHFTKNFIVFKTSDTTLDVYNNDYKLIKQQLLVDSPGRIDNYSYDFLAYYYQKKLHLMSVTGKVTPINYNYQRVIPVNNNYFLGLYTDSLFYKIIIVFNSDGENLYVLRERNGDFTDEDFIERFSLLKQYFGNQIVLPIVPDKIRMDDYYTPIQQAGIIAILKDTVYTISLGDSLCWISANYTDAGPATSQFNIITRCNTNPGVYKSPIYYYIDKYGTIYYDE